MTTIGRSKSIRQAIHLCALAGLLSHATGCVSSVVEAYRADVMPDPMYFWVLDTEDPEVRIEWSRWDPNKTIESPLADPLFDPPPKVLELRPGIPGCRTYEVYVNDLERRLSDQSQAVAVHAVREPTPTLPDDRFPECTVLLTYRRLPARPGLVVVATTRAGVLGEFPNGRRKPAWLILAPFAAVVDSAAFLAVGAFFVVISPAFWVH